MRRRVLFYILCALTLLLTACAQTESRTSPQEAVEPQPTPAEKTEDEAIGEQVESAGAGQVVRWQGLYRDFLKEGGFLNPEGFQCEAYYTLIHLDEDDIPELLISSPVRADRNFLCYITDGAVTYQVYPGSTVFQYIPYTGKYLLSTMVEGHGSDDVGSFDHGEFAIIASGKFQEGPWVEAEEYNWEKNTVSKKEYLNLLSLSFDEWEAVSPYSSNSEADYLQCYSAEEFYDYLTIHLELLETLGETVQSDSGTAPASSEADAAYSDYLEKRCYLEYGGKFNAAEHEISYRYSLLDIDRDGLNELILEYEYAATYVAILRYDEKLQRIVEICDYELTRAYYSDVYRAIVFPQRFGGGHFYRLENGEFNYFITVAMVYDYESSVDLSDPAALYYLETRIAKAYITENEFNELMRTVTYPDYISLSVDDNRDSPESELTDAERAVKRFEEYIASGQHLAYGETMIENYVKLYSGIGDSTDESLRSDFQLGISSLYLDLNQDGVDELLLQYASPVLIDYHFLVYAYDTDTNQVCQIADIRSDYRIDHCPDHKALVSIFHGSSPVYELYVMDRIPSNPMRLDMKIAYYAGRDQNPPRTEDEVEVFEADESGTLRLAYQAESFDWDILGERQILQFDPLP